MRVPKFRRVWIDKNKSDGHPGPWKRGWQKIARPSWRARAKKAMEWGLWHEPDIHYSLNRPFDPDVYLKRKLPAKLDCSGTVVSIYKDAGRPDPTGGVGYSGGKPGDPEYTGTLRSHTPERTSLRAMRTGDFFVHGTGSGSHTTLVYKPGKTPEKTLVYSHGQEKGPIITTLAVQMEVHGWYYTMHDGGRLK